MRKQFLKPLESLGLSQQIDASSHISPPPVAAKHEWHTADAYCTLAIATLLDNNLFPPCVLDVHSDWRCIGDVPQPALLGCDVGLHHVLLDTRSADVDIQEPAMI